MFCKHPVVDDPEGEKAEQLTMLLGLNTNVWLRKIKNNEQFTDEDIANLRTDLEMSFDLPRAGERYGDWEAAQCGRVDFPEIDQEIPIPFAPVMAGTLIAGEVIKELHFPEHVLDSYYWNTLIGQFLRHHVPQRRVPSGDCTFCSDDSFLQQYRRRLETS